MEAAGSKIILERLKEEWVEAAEASVYRELELEKQRWMLFALRDLKTTRLSSAEQTRTFQVYPPGATSVLSLFENRASFLSALSSPITDVHHLCKTPLSPRSYPNVFPTTVPEYTTSLPYDSESFTSIHAFSLPTLFPASSIPQVLTECHRLLAPSPLSAASPMPPLQPFTIRDRHSTLHLTIIDPSPIAATAGPLLRAWLDKHLILNLEKQFRCIHPSRLFPMWLTDAGLRAEGSMIITVPFLASMNTQEAENLLLGHGPAKGGAVDRNDIVKQELKSVVGRMLWKETWGPFVQARRWWWEDANIVEECERMRTCWEYSVLDAVKGMSDT
ncbi:hypothetical protein BJ875DRAFT_384971 [Amylocarpus encephaloides]|uniref:Uncharacterized protein n=1 Tax=Amylocarpus encephaloides TaxID=45428 RepID=A0A9P7YBZ8_9HELO|nr:hypothetical protein BJ875DRAFT_384971 [Amylocarpus encephaloides]